MMLRHLGEIDLAGRIEQACYDVITSRQHVTFDLGGTATTSEFAQAISSQL
jgi:isocitrate dehydrogenase (NAD+)